MTKRKNTKPAPTLGYLELAERVARETLENTLSPDYVAGCLDVELPSAADTLSRSNIDITVGELLGFVYDIQADARAWGEAAKALMEARARAKKAA